MKVLILTLFLALGTSVRAQIVDLYKQPPKKTASRQMAVLRHVVLFKFRADTPADILRKIEGAFNALPEEIPEIREFEWGINNSPEGADKGFTHCYLLTFSSEEDRAVYLPHPKHKAFGELISPWLEDVLVVDYWAQ
jgi:hypothetical protein